MDFFSEKFLPLKTIKGSKSPLLSENLNHSKNPKKKVKFFPKRIFFQKGFAGSRQSSEKLNEKSRSTGLSRQFFYELKKTIEILEK